MYTEHSKIEVHSFDIVDSTQDERLGRNTVDLIWVGVYGEGRWLTATEVEELAGALFGAAATHRTRRALTPVTAEAA